MAEVSKLSDGEKKLIGFLMIVIATIPFFTFTLPAWKEYRQIVKNTTENKSKAKDIKLQIDKLDKLKAENKNLENEVETRKTFLAKSYEIDFLIQDLKNICDESSVSLESFTPTTAEPINIVLEKQVEAQLQGQGQSQAASKSDLKRRQKSLEGENLPVDLYRFPIEVRVTGNFTDILELFKKLEKYGRVISIENISIGKVQAKRSFGGGGNRYSKSAPKKEEADDGTLFGSFDLIAYSLAEKNEVLPFNSLERSSKSTFKITSSKKR